MADHTRFELVISSVTEKHVKPLHQWFVMAGHARFELATDRLTADCSTVELMSQMEQVRRIELPLLPWQGNILPLNYTCSWSGIRDLHSFSKLGRITSYYIDEYRIIW